MADQEIPADLKRCSNWELRLSETIADRLHQPFAWGSNDCVMFAAACIEAITGAALVDRLDRTWSSQSEAIRAIAKLGGIGATVDRMGLIEVPPLCAQRGDLVLHRRSGNDALAICLGDKLAGPSDSGLLFFGLENGVRAWRVG